MKPLLLLLIVACVIWLSGSKPVFTAPQTSAQRPVSYPTPAPTPRINPNSYIPPRPAGRTMTVASSQQLSEAIQQAQDDPNVTSVRITGGGSLTRPVVLKKYSTFTRSSITTSSEPGGTRFRSTTSRTV